MESDYLMMGVVATSQSVGEVQKLFTLLVELQSVARVVKPGGERLLDPSVTQTDSRRLIHPSRYSWKVSTVTLTNWTAAACLSLSC